MYIYINRCPGAISPIPSDKDDIVPHILYISLELHGSPGRRLPQDPTFLATMSLRVRSEACETGLDLGSG